MQYNAFDAMWYKHREILYSLLHPPLVVCGGSHMVIFMHTQLIVMELYRTICALVFARKSANNADINMRPHQPIEHTAGATGKIRNMYNL